MALYNTVSVPCQQSCWSLQEINNYTLNTTEVLTVGMCWWDGVQCFEILSLNGSGDLDPIVPTAVYNNCDECFSQNQLGAFISPCSGGLRETFWLPGYAICEGATYEFNGVCFQTGRIEPYFPGKQEPITFPEQPTLIGQESCLLCLQSGYTYLYQVTDCLTSETHIVGSDISYSCVKTGGIYSYVLESDPTTQRCGTLQCVDFINPIVEGFITGFIGFDENSCDVCLGQANKKVEVINCIDQSIEVVWASTFFNVDDITFIDFTVPGREGSTQIRCCYTIGEETEAEVTIPTILSYSVSPSCPECIECNGVYYLWEDCSNSEITGSSLSYQYMTVGQTFVSPSNDGSCKKIIGASTNLSTDLLAGSLVDNEFTIQSNQFNDRVRFFFEQPDGKFLIGGHFTSFGSNTTNKIVRLNSDGTYDNTFVGGFSPGSSNYVIIDIDQQSDGKIIVAGQFNEFDNGITANTNTYICRLNTDGTFDTTFLPVLNNTGFDNTTQCVEVQNDGKILVGGWFDNYDDGSGSVLANRLIRLNSDGSVDSTFNTGTGFINNTEGDNGRVFQTKTQLDGKIIVVGQFDEYDGLPAKGIIRLNSDGSRDITFNMGTGFDGNPLDGYGYYLARWINLYPDGKMLISGHFEYYDGQPASKLIRLNSDGSVDTTFTSLVFGPTGGDDRAIQTQIQPDGKIIVGGFFGTYNSESYEKLIRLNSDGTIDTSFFVGSGFNDYVLATYITSDYRLLVGGQFLTYKTSSQAFITELNLTPQIDTIYSSPIFTDCPNCVEQTTTSDYTWYEFLPCNGGNVGYILMDSTFNLVGNIVRANYSDNSIICGTIGDPVIEFPESGDMYTLTGQTTYESCVECNNGLVYGVTLRNCKTNELLTRNMNPNTVIEVLLNGSIFSTFPGIDCYQLLDFCVIPNDAITIIPYLLFNDCDLCLAPRSANTEVTFCEEICDLSGGTTVVEVIPPHPVWTDGYGIAVTQLNMVVLGGPNGLNA